MQQNSNDMILNNVRNRALVTISFRQIIDINSKGSFEKNVFNDSYEEFLLQSQSYNQDKKFRTFQEMLSAVPKSASLHYKVGFSVGLYIKALGNKIPGLFANSGKEINFISHQFELINSDLLDKSIHQLAITYNSDSLILLDCLSDYLLLSTANYQTYDDSQPVECFLLRIQDGVSINTYQGL